MRSEPIRPHYVNIASGSFFGVGFCSVCWLQLFYFFSLSLKKNKCAALRWLTKTMTKKLTATPYTALSFGGVSRAVGGLFRLCISVDVYILSPGFALKFVD